MNPGLDRGDDIGLMDLIGLCRRPFAGMGRKLLILCGTVFQGDGRGERVIQSEARHWGFPLQGLLQDGEQSCQSFDVRIVVWLMFECFFLHPGSRARRKFGRSHRVIRFEIQGGGRCDYSEACRTETLDKMVDQSFIFKLDLVFGRMDVDINSFGVDVQKEHKAGVDHPRSVLRALRMA